LQHPAFADFANEAPNVNITRAARLRTPIVIFFIKILLIKVLTADPRDTGDAALPPHQKAFALGFS
jgi:hypothetical protein